MSQEGVGAEESAGIIRINGDGVDVEEAGEVVGERAGRGGAERGWRGVPDPEEIVDSVMVDEAVEELAVKGGGAVDALPSGPPEGPAVGVW